MAQSTAAPAPAPSLPCPLLGDPRRTVLEVEVFVVAAAALLFFQLIFGFFRRQSSSKWIQGGVWVAYTLSFPLVTYTMGLMQSSPAKSQLYPVWAISLFLVAGCTNSITAYDLDDNKQWKKHLFELAQHYFYAALIFLLLAPVRLSVLSEFGWNATQFKPILMACYALLATTMITNLFRVIACWMANFSDSSKVVADYMRDQADSREAQLLQGSEYDPISMKGYKYLVRWYGYFLNTADDAKVPSYRNKLAEEDAITIDRIWEKCNDGLFDSNGQQIKDVCLSFSLFHLLKRRYFGIKCYEANLPETRDFVLKGLLVSEDGNNYARAFRIIEVELGFTHDFFFTKYATIFENEIFFFALLIMKIIFTVILGVSVYHKSLTVMTNSPIIEVKTLKVDIFITLVILGALLVVDIVQTMLYLASDWALVSLACYRVRNGSCQAFLYSLLSKPIYILRKRSLFKYWQNRIGQHSVIEGCRWYKAAPQTPQKKVNWLFIFIIWKVQMLVEETVWQIWTCRYFQSIVKFVRLPDTVKREIASSLKSTVNGHLTNGEASLRRNGVLCRFSWTLNRDDWNLTDTMLIWHIATDYCEKHTNSGQDQLSHYYREVATSLSRYCSYLMACVPELLPGNSARYCSYLMACVPELLPGNSADISFTFEKVMQEATVALYPEEKDDIRGRKVVDRGMLEAILSPRSPDQENQNDTIFVKGLQLGRELEERIQEEVPRWKVMAEFWAETILYAAPSDNVRGHIERLANGGEFITHIWALLSHAGILTR
ncbi:hypothetical protein ACP70R_045100 [Stipagrostis hirtigluma subsp. patula]